MKDLEFDIRARDKTGDAFNAIRGRAKEWNGEFDRMGQSLRIAGDMAKAFAAGFSITAVSEFSRAIRGVVTEAADLADLADKVGVSTEDLQRMTYGFGEAGVAAGDVDQILTQWSKRIGEAHTKGGQLADLFRVNGISMTDANGKLRSNVELMREFAELVKNAGSEQEQLALNTQAFGRAGDAMVLVTREGKAGWDEMIKSIERAGGVYEEEMLRTAAEVDDAWNRTWSTFERNSKSAILSAVDEMEKLRQEAANFGNTSFFKWITGGMASAGLLDSSVTLLDPDLARRAGQQLAPDARVRDAFGSTVSQVLTQADQALIEELQRRYSSFKKQTVIPGKDDDDPPRRDRSAQAAREQESAYEKVIQKLAEEQMMLGLNATEQRILTEQRRAGVIAASAEGREIAAKIRFIEEERAAMERLQDQQKAMNDAAQYLGEVGFDALEILISKSEDAEDAIKRLGLELLKAAAYAAFFNEGPLSGLFGGWSLGGGGGAGIITDLKAPQLAMAGVGAAMLASARAQASVQGGAQKSTVELKLSRDLEARVLEKAGAQAVEISQGTVDQFSKTIPDQIAHYQREPRVRRS